MWGVFETEESVHVIPINKDLKIRKPHTIDDFCKCYPKIVENGYGTISDRYILNHNEIN